MRGSCLLWFTVRKLVWLHRQVVVRATCSLPVAGWLRARLRYPAAGSLPPRHCCCHLTLQMQVPPSGKRVESDPAARKAAATKAAAEAAAAKAAASRLGTEWDTGTADSKPSAYVDPNSLDAEASGTGGPGWSVCKMLFQQASRPWWPPQSCAGLQAICLLLPCLIAAALPAHPTACLQRRSSRLVSRQCKEEEARRQQELEAAAAAAASAAEQAEAAAAEAAARAMAVVPTTAKGAPAKRLLDVLPEQRLGLLLKQVGCRARGRAACIARL